jgi:hypothetical protein
LENDLAHAPAAGPAIVAGGAELVAVLIIHPTDVGHRADPDTWSPLGHGCRVRDVLLVQRQPVLAARRVDGPEFDPDLDAVTRQLPDAAAPFAHVLARIDGEDREPIVVHPFPNRLERSLRWVAPHTLHEVRHHLPDVRRHLGAGPDRG